MKLFNLGVGDPLTLGMAHPLAERVQNLGNNTVRQSLSRSAAGAIIIGGAIVSAPLTLASNKAPAPQQTEELAGKSDVAKRVSVLKIKTSDEVNGEGNGYEVESKSGTVQFFKIDENGVKTVINSNKIEGLNVEGLEGLRVIFADGSAVSELQGVESDKILANIINNLSEFQVGDSFSFNLDDDFEFDGDNAAYVERLAKLQEGGLSDIIGRPDVVSGQIQFTSNKFNERQLESLLNAATTMIESAQDSSAKISETGGDLKRVETELAKALKALEKAEKALENAESP